MRLCRRCAYKLDKRNGGRYILTPDGKPERFSMCSWCGNPSVETEAYNYESADVAAMKRALQARQRSFSYSGNRNGKAHYKEKFREENWD